MMVGRKRKAPPWMASYIRRAFRLRRELTNRALARRFCLNEKTLRAYGYGQHKEAR